MGGNQKPKGKLEKIVETSEALLVIGTTLAASAAIVGMGKIYDGYKALGKSYSSKNTY